MLKQRLSLNKTFRQITKDTEVFYKWLNHIRSFRNNYSHQDLYDKGYIDILLKENIIDNTSVEIVKYRLIDKMTYKAIGEKLDLKAPKVAKLYEDSFHSIALYTFIRNIDLGE